MLLPCSIPPMASHLTLKKIRILTVTSTVLQGLAPTVPLTSSPTTLPLFYSLKPHWPPCCSPNMLLPQDLCTCYSICLKCSALRSMPGFILDFLQVSTLYFHFRKTFPGHFI